MPQSTSYDPPTEDDYAYLDPFKEAYDLGYQAGLDGLSYVNVYDSDLSHHERDCSSMGDQQHYQWYRGYYDGWEDRPKPDSSTLSPMAERKYILYTVGRTDIYEPYIASDPYPGKGKGGTVWPSWRAANDHCPEGFSVYGVVADWELDTEVDPEGDGVWHRLTRNAALVSAI
jgi:hypothetical protein